VWAATQLGQDAQVFKVAAARSPRARALAMLRLTARWLAESRGPDVPMRPGRPRQPGHRRLIPSTRRPDRQRCAVTIRVGVAVDLAVMLADGGEAIRDLAAPAA